MDQNLKTYIHYLTLNKSNSKLKTGMPQRTNDISKFVGGDDPEQLQALDENNREWVASWKKTVKKKRVKTQSHSRLL